MSTTMRSKLAFLSTLFCVFNVSLTNAQGCPDRDAVCNGVTIPPDIGSPFTDYKSLRNAVSRGDYIGINCWDVSQITSMTGMFVEKRTFNENIACWDTSNVRSMYHMFVNSLRFNQDISSWDTSQVTDMFQMFDGATDFNKDISTWDVSKVTDMGGMFSDAHSFNQDISSWNISSVTNMKGMFDYAWGFNQDLCRWGMITTITDETRFERMFRSATSCPTQDVPNITANPKGPFCTECRFTTTSSNPDSITLPPTTNDPVISTPPPSSGGTSDEGVQPTDMPTSGTSKILLLPLVSILTMTLSFSLL